MPEYLVFQNQGEIDPRLITTMGTNVKVGDSPIGYFGTGLKYAIAISLRLGGTVTIQSGLGELTFDTYVDNIRGKEFGFIRMNGSGSENCQADNQLLGFTTELGKNWQPWMAYREFYCNAMDEPEATVYVGSTIPEPEPNVTKIIVTNCPELMHAHTNKHEWLLDTNSKVYDKTECLEIHPHNGTKNYYYRGIKVGEFDSMPRYTYNVTDKLILTEDRTCHPTYIDSKIIAAIKDHTQNPNVIREILLPAEGSPESKIYWSIRSKPNETFCRIFEELLQTRRALLNPNLVNQMLTYLPPEEPKRATLTPVQCKMVKKARDFLSAMGYNITHQIVFVETLGSQWISGLAERDKIYIPISTFGKGTKFLTSTLLEEHLHLTLNLRDESRELQDYLFDKVISMAEEQMGEPL